MAKMPIRVFRKFSKEEILRLRKEAQAANGNLGWVASKASKKPIQPKKK